MSRPAIWQAFVIQAFRVPIRLAFALGRPSLKDFQHLMKTAIVRELRAQGLSIRQMAVALDVTDTWASKMVKGAQSIGDKADKDALLYRMVETLREGPVSDLDLMEFLPHGAHFRLDKVALALLIKAGIAAPLQPGGDSYALTERFERLSEDAWVQPLKEVEARQLLAVKIVQILYEGGALKGEDIKARLKKNHGDAACGEALEVLVGEGIVSRGEGSEGAYELKGEHLILIPPEVGARRRTGMMTMLDAFGDAATQMMIADESEPLGQRTLRFRATPEAFRCFIRSHYEWTMGEIRALDDKAEEDDEGEDHLMVWVAVKGRG